MTTPSDESLGNDSIDYIDDYYSEIPEVAEVCDVSKGLHFAAVFLPVLYTLTLVLGVLGNGLVLGVLAKNGRRGKWSVADTFIVHLAVADSLVLVTLPFWAVQAAHGRWTFGTGRLGTALCKISGAMFTINFYCGIYLLACISLDRYLSIVHATQTFSRRKPWMVQASCLSIWLFCFLLSIPDWIFLGVVEDTRRDTVRCGHDYKAKAQSAPNWRLASRLLYHIVGFLLPAAVLLFCYSGILLRLRLSNLGHQKHRAVRVILALVLLFFLCWTPYNVTLLTDTLYSNNTEADTCQSRTNLSIALTVTSSVGYLHSSLNPVLYAFVGVKFRRHLLDILRSMGCRLKTGTGLQSTVSRKSSTSESGNTSNTLAI